MRAEIISIGTELLLGRIINTNASFLSARIAELGIDIYHQITVGDNVRRLSEAIGDALSRSDIVIMTGGLGPTVDDITMEAVSSATGIELILDQKILKFIRNIYISRSRRMPDGNERQAIVPRGSLAFTNDFGTAPGVVIKYNDKVIICLPGPPREMHPMFCEKIIPYLKKYYPSGYIFKTRTIKTIGLAEAEINTRLKDLLMLKPPITVGIYAKLREVHLVIMVKASDKKSASSVINKIEREITKRLKEYIFGYDDELLEEVVGRLLLRKKMTLAVAESCTGGLVSKRITDIAGSSAYFKAGIVTYSNEAKESLLGVSLGLLKRYGAVSKEVALDMATGVRERASSNIGISITGIAGPSGAIKTKPVGLVYIACVFDDKYLVKEFRFQDTREDVRWLSSQMALDIIRRNI